MKLTATTITDEQIRELGSQSANGGDYFTAMWCDYALVTDSARFDIPDGCDREAARTRIAEILNERQESTSGPIAGPK